MNGGFPEIVVDGENPKIYLEALFDQIIRRDVIIRYTKIFLEIAKALISNPDNFSSKKA